MIRRNTWVAILLSIGVGIVMGSSVVTIRAQEPAAKAEVKAAEPAAAPAAAAAAAPEAAAPAPPPPDPTAPPTGPDSTGASYTGASTTAALTVDADKKVTLETLAKDVKLLKIGINIFWTLMTGLPRHVHAGRLRAGRDRADAGQERRPHDGDELHGLRHRHARLLDLRLRAHVRRPRPGAGVRRPEHPRQDVARSASAASRSRSWATRASSSPARPTTRRS